MKKQAMIVDNTSSSPTPKPMVILRFSHATLTGYSTAASKNPVHKPVWNLSSKTWNGVRPRVLVQDQQTREITGAQKTSHVEFMNLVVAGMPGESSSWCLRSLLCLRGVCWALINSLGCWFYHLQFKFSNNLKMYPPRLCYLRLTKPRKKERKKKDEKKEEKKQRRGKTSPQSLIYYNENLCSKRVLLFFPPKFNRIKQWLHF